MYSPTLPAVALPPATVPTSGNALARTNAVLASCVVFVPTAAVGAVGVPVKAGLASGAELVATNAVVANAVELLPAVCVTPVVPVGNEGVPVKTGDASGAAPKLVNAAPAVVALVPPLAIDSGMAAVANPVNKTLLVLKQGITPADVMVQSCDIVTGVNAVVEEATSI